MKSLAMRECKYCEKYDKFFALTHPTNTTTSVRDSQFAGLRHRTPASGFWRFGDRLQSFLQCLNVLFYSLASLGSVVVFRLDESLLQFLHVTWSLLHGNQIFANSIVANLRVAFTSYI